MEDLNRRILIVDDNLAIHEDIRKILDPSRGTSQSFTNARAAYFGKDAKTPSRGAELEGIEIDCAQQGEEGLAMVQTAVEEERPYAMAFVDVRMPPGWDGIQTVERMWQVDPNMQAVICTAFSDYSWEQTLARLGRTDRLLILKKPFDSVEICQMVSALTEKWNLSHRERQLIDDLRNTEQEARAYSASLETVNRALMTARAAANRSSEMKSEFLVRLSQQINRSMARITGQVDSLRAFGEEGPTDTGSLDAIAGASRDLIRLFDETLDLTRLESGQLSLDYSTTHPLQIAQHVVSEHIDEADRKGLELQVTSAGPIPAEIQSDPIRFEQILDELIDNAIRFTRSGKVLVELALEDTDNWRSPLLRCRVIDTGPGVDPIERGRIFEPFHRLERSEGGEDCQAGLGLALCKQLAQLMGGDIVVEDGPDGGSLFQLTVDAGDLSNVRLI